MDKGISATLSEWAPWLAAVGLGGERLIKLWSDYRDRRGRDASQDVVAAESIFRRANELLDRYRGEIAEQDKEIHAQRVEIDQLNREMLVLRARILALEGPRA